MYPSLPIIYLSPRRKVSVHPVCIIDATIFSAWLVRLLYRVPRTPFVSILYLPSSTRTRSPFCTLVHPTPFRLPRAFFVAGLAHSTPVARACRELVADRSSLAITLIPPFLSHPSGRWCSYFEGLIAKAVAAEAEANAPADEGLTADELEEVSRLRKEVEAFTRQYEELLDTLREEEVCRSSLRPRRQRQPRTLPLL